MGRFLFYISLVPGWHAISKPWFHIRWVGFHVELSFQKSVRDTDWMSGIGHKNQTVVELHDGNLTFSKDWVIKSKNVRFFLIGSSRWPFNAFNGLHACAESYPDSIKRGLILLQLSIGLICMFSRVTSYEKVSLNQIIAHPKQRELWNPDHHNTGVGYLS